MEISEFQELIRTTYIHHDVRRGIDNTFLWLKSEVDELEEAIKAEDIENQEEEIADVLAWLMSVANLLNIDVEKAATERYGGGCPKCGSISCRCPFREKPTK